jgi:primosomal protein N'
MSGLRLVQTKRTSPCLPLNIGSISVQIKVILDVPAMKNSEPYVYNVPPALETNVGVGKRFLVPLGPQLVHGFIYEIGLMDTGRGSKSVVGILDDQRRLPDEILELAAWLAWRMPGPDRKNYSGSFSGDAG